MNMILILAIGLLGGLASGFLGIGGAVIMVPMLTSLLQFPQKLAQGTTLLMFMIAPSFLAAIQYYKSGNADIKIAMLLWVGVFIGSALGAWAVNTLFKDSTIFMVIIKRVFAFVMVCMAIRMWMTA